MHRRATRPARGVDGHAWEAESGGDLALAATGRATHGKVKLGRRAIVVVIAGAHDRPHRAGVEQTFANKPLVDIHPDHLAEYHMAVGGTALIVGERHGLQPFAFERARRRCNPRRLDKPRRGRRKPAFLHFIDTAGERRRGLVELLAQVVGGEIADELLGLLDEGERILPLFAGEHHHRGSARHPVEPRIGREVDVAGGAYGGDPADRSRRDDGLERIVGQAVIVLLAGVVEHLRSICLLPAHPGKREGNHLRSRDASTSSRKRDEARVAATCDCPDCKPGDGYWKRVTMSARAGRGRSSGACTGRPMWTNPAIFSWAASPSASRTLRS